MELGDVEAMKPRSAGSPGRIDRQVEIVMKELMDRYRPAKSSGAYRLSQKSVFVGFFGVV